MKKKITLIFIGSTFILVALFSSKYNLSNNRKFKSLFLANVEALAQQEIDFGTQYSKEEDCRNNGGYWNMALTLAGGGINSVQCEKAGELTIAGYTLFKASYKKGQTYNVKWERYACEKSDGNCCIAASQGVYIKD